MLIVLFRIGEERFGLDARCLIEILPAVPLRAFPAAPPGIAGLLAHRGRTLPVIDLGLLTSGAPCAARLSTRILVAEYPPGPPGAAIGLRVENAYEAIRVEPADLNHSGVTAPDARYLERVIQHPDGLIQLIDVVHLIPESLQHCLYQEADVT
jgi:chemotaxis-related protein WspB